MASDQFDKNSASEEGMFDDTTPSVEPAASTDSEDVDDSGIRDLKSRLATLMEYKSELEYMAKPGQMLSKPNLIRGAKIWVRSMILVAVSSPFIDVIVGKGTPVLAGFINFVLLIIAITLSQKAASRMAREEYDFQLQPSAWWSIHWRHTVFLMLFGFIFAFVLSLILILFGTDTSSLVGEVYTFYISMLFIGLVTLSLALLGYATSCAMLIGINKEIDTIMKRLFRLGNNAMP